jgi:hypothetical protein
MGYINNFFDRYTFSVGTGNATWKIIKLCFLSREGAKNHGPGSGGTVFVFGTNSL